MELVRPLALGGRLGSSVSSNITPAYPTMVKGLTFNPGDRAIHNGYIYLCHTTVTIFNEVTALVLTSFTKEGLDNAAAMWDSEISTQSTLNTGNITISMTLVEPIDTIAILNLLGSYASIEVREYVGGPLLYEDTQALTGDVVLDWYQYFFFTYADQRTQVVWRNIPPHSNSVITIPVTAPPTPGIPSVGVGYVLAGTTVSLGSTQYGLQAGILDYSKKETDSLYGTTSFLKRAFSRRLSATVAIDSSQLNRVYRTLSDTRATPSLWITTDDPSLSEAGVVFGFYRDFNIEFNMPTLALCTIEIEGLT